MEKINTDYKQQNVKAKLNFSNPFNRDLAILSIDRVHKKLQQNPRVNSCNMTLASAFDYDAVEIKPMKQAKCFFLDFFPVYNVNKSFSYVRITVCRFAIAKF